MRIRIYRHGGISNAGSRSRQKKGSAQQHKSGWHCNFVIYNLPTVADLLYYGILELPDVAVLGGQLLLQAVRPPLHLHHQGLPRFYLIKFNCG